MTSVPTDTELTVNPREDIPEEFSNRQWTQHIYFIQVSVKPTAVDVHALLKIKVDFLWSQGSNFSRDTKLYWPLY